MAVLFNVMHKAWSVLPTSFKSKIKVPFAMRVAYSRERCKEMFKSSASLKLIREILDDLSACETPQILEDRCNENLLSSDMKPNFGIVEINNSCNLNCLMCETKLSKRSKGLMSLELFERVVSVLKEHGNRGIQLHSVGDPLANKRLPEYLEILRKSGLIITKLSSNCQSLDEHLDTIFEYKDIISSFRPSIDAATKSTYETIRSGGSWEKLHKNLLMFANRNKKESKPIFVHISNVITKDNYSEIAYIPDVFSYLAPPENNSFSFFDSTSPSNKFFLLQNFFGDEYSHKLPCRDISGAHVLLDGSITSCCRDYHGDLIYGHIDDGDLENTFKSEKRMQWRKAHRDGVIENLPRLCKGCLTVDPRYSKLLQAIIGFFYLKVRKHPGHLQDALNDIRDPLLKKDYRRVFLRLKTL